MKKIIALISFSTLLLLSYQNCSGVKFTKADPTSNKDGTVSTGGDLSNGDQTGDYQDNNGDNSNNNGDQANNPPPPPYDPSADCDSLRTNLDKAVTIASGGSIINMNGNLILKSENIAEISSTVGNIRIAGIGDAASIGKISASNGNILICGMDVGRIENMTVGNIYVVDGNVGDLDGFRGNLTIVRGTITGSMTNGIGNIKIK